MALEPVKLKKNQIFFNREWRNKLGDRVVALLIYIGVVMGVCLILSFFSPFVGAFTFWTFVNGETSYFGWHYLGLHPLRGYLAIVLTTATIHQTVMWFVVFRGEVSLLELSFAERFFNASRKYPRFYNWARERGKRGLFILGLTPLVWWVGFVIQRERPVRFGVAAVQLGNVTKLTTFSVFYWLSSEWILFGIPAMVIVVLFFPTRLVERFMPANRFSRYRPQ